MAVSGVYGIVLEVPNLEDGREFYSAAGLEVQEQQDRLVFTCKGQERAAITLIRGAGKKRLHHIILTSDDLSFDLTKENVIKYGGTVVAAPEGFEENGLWIKDPHGLLVHLITGAPETPLSAKEVFEINQPGRTIRIDKAAVTPKSKTPKILPLRLGHIMLFTPNTMKSVEFFSEALGMGLADRAQDTVAFMCARKNSDHHVVAFA
ncbi:MAG: hypothetical protein JKY45_02635, partial [Emcibacter sp.]|nr:hypothetical protein [Emcibacter sp.]